MAKNKIWYNVAISIIVASIFFLIFRILVSSKINNLQITSDDGLVPLDDAQTVHVDLQGVQDAIVSNIEKYKETVVAIVAEVSLPLYTENDIPTQVTVTKKLLNKGNGILISKDGYILTNKHVVQETGMNYQVKIGSIKYKVEKIWFDPYIDIAVVKIKPEQETLAAQVASIEDTIPQGSIVFAMKKSEKNKENIVSMGILSAKNQEFSVANNENIYAGMYQTDAQINAGYSWGPLINIEGKVIGMNTAIVSTEKGVAYALPLTQQYVDETIESIQAYGKILRPYIGVQVRDIDDALQAELLLLLDAGAYVQSVDKDSPGYGAGIRAGDVIVGINGKDLSTQMPFMYQLYTYKIGKTITLNAIRNGKKIDFEVFLWKKE